MRDELSSHATPVKSAPRLRLALSLWALLLLFVLRVIGQLLVALGRGGFLPPMSEWYSGLLSYRWLLPCQLLIIALYGAVCLQLTRGCGFFSRARRRTGACLLGFGAIYFGSMILRYILTMALYPQRRWTGGLIPVFFHLVLATFILLVGRDYYMRALHEGNAPLNSVMGEMTRWRRTSINSLTAGGCWRRSQKSRR